MGHWDEAKRLLEGSDSGASEEWLRAIEQTLPGLRRAVERGDRTRVLMMVEALKGYLAELGR